MLAKKFSNLSDKIRIRDKTVGRGEPVFVIAEIGNNHNGDMALAKKTIDGASLAGADAVKFQKRTLKAVFTKEMLDKPQTSSRALGATYGEYRAKLELSEDQLRELRDYAHSKNMAFFVTAFDLESAEALSRLNMDVWKIASFDATHPQLIEYVAKQGGPVIMSMGMSTDSERVLAIHSVLKHNPKLIVLHCVSVYPTPNEDLNIGAVKTMLTEYYPLPIGYSGHEIGFEPTLAAVTLGASVVERHITLDKSLPGPDHATVSLDIFEFAQMVKQIRRLEKAVADDKLYLHANEIPHRQKHGKSLVAKVKIPAGIILTADMIVCKSPGHGISPLKFQNVIGKAVKNEILEDTVIKEEDVIW